MNYKMDVEGIILILSCKKHRYGRLKNLSLKEQYNGWKVIKVIGNLFLDKDFELIDDLLFIKCEDSYIHLLKKLGLSLKYLYKLYNIKQGVLRCGDDLLFNEENLINFLQKSEKPDFYGRSHNPRFAIQNREILDKIQFRIEYDPFMYNYYKNHENELSDKEHGIHLTLDQLKRYLIRPSLDGPRGVIYYISNKACKTIIDTMEEFEYNIFHLDEHTMSYPYVIEDIGVIYIMYRNKIPCTDNRYIYMDENYYTKDTIAVHTNYDK
jgi:hypothetical protein